MISDKKLNILIQNAINKQIDINCDVIYKIAKEIKHISNLSVNELNTYTYPFSKGEILKYIKEKSHNEIDTIISAIIWKIAHETYLDSKRLYIQRDMQFIPIIENIAIMSAIAEIDERAKSEFEQILNKSVIVTKNMNRVNVPMMPDSATKNILDYALQQRRLNTNYTQNMQKVIDTLVNSGIRTPSYKENGQLAYTRSLDSVLENILQYSVRDVENKIYEIVGTQTDSNGVELSAHMFSAPDHEPVQGRQFTDYEFDKMQSGMSFLDINGIAYSGFARPIGAWNCRHIIKRIIVGVSKPEYTEEQLQYMAHKNAKGFFTSDGKHYTMYECTQALRRYEYDIRKNKLKAETFYLSGDTKNGNLYEAIYHSLENQYIQFSQECGLEINPDNTRIKYV